MRSSELVRLVAVASDIGWIGIALHNQIIVQVRIGFMTRSELLDRFSMPATRANDQESRIAGQLQQFAAGQRTCLSGLRIDQSWMTAFQRRVTDACRQIPWGETLSYGQLAAIAGSPGASRAVGTVMAKNRCPLIVPCHRVVACRGLGGFSAPRGVPLKERLLANERDCVVPV